MTADATVALHEIAKSCLREGCWVCGVKPTPATFRQFCSYVTCDADGNVCKISHVCAACRVEAN